MQVWVVCFLILFVGTQFYEWVQGLSLPFPALMIAGALLAIASNFSKVFPLNAIAPQNIAPQNSAPNPVTVKPQAVEPQLDAQEPSQSSPLPPKLSESDSKHLGPFQTGQVPELPHLKPDPAPNSAPEPSISFKIPRQS